ncbi:MAG: FHA domain-containing protein [Planctomycetaceae bacterium]|nr:FHA domain-containing protein [Planctomycetaceae bacterium]
MARITIQVLEGFERGRVYTELATPVTIGREEDNTIQLNDERVSRFHVKIQEDGGRIILTDLESTNGTRINGHPMQVRVLQHGDQMSIGRSLLWYGSAKEIDAQSRDGSRTGPDDDSDDGAPVAPELRTVSSPPGEFPLENFSGEPSGQDSRQDLFPQGPPPLPVDMRMAQMAQLSDVLAYIHDQLAFVAEQAAEVRQGSSGEMRMDRLTWQRMLRLEMQLAAYLRQITDPPT